MLCLDNYAIIYPFEYFSFIGYLNSVEIRHIYNTNYTIFMLLIRKNNEFFVNNDTK